MTALQTTVKIWETQLYVWRLQDMIIESAERQQLGANFCLIHTFRLCKMGDYLEQEQAFESLIGSGSSCVANVSQNILCDLLKWFPERFDQNQKNYRVDQSVQLFQK